MCSKAHGLFFRIHPHPEPKTVRRECGEKLLTGLGERVRAAQHAHDVSLMIPWYVVGGYPPGTPSDGKRYVEKFRLDKRVVLKKHYSNPERITYVLLLCTL